MYSMESGDLWPKAVTRIWSSGEVVVQSELAMCYEFGLTNQQLNLHINLAVASRHRLFDKLDEIFPNQASVRENAK